MADLYMYCATLPSVSGTVEDSDAGWNTEKAVHKKVHLTGQALLIKLILSTGSMARLLINQLLS